MSGKDSYALTPYCSRSHSVTSESSKGLSWNEHLRKKPANYKEVCGVEEYDTINKLIEKNTDFQVFIGGKRYTVVCLVPDIHGH